MATVIENGSSREERGLGLAGIIAIIIVVLLAAFLLFRSLGANDGGNLENGADVNVSGSLGETSGSF